MTDVPDRLQEWDEFSEAVREHIKNTTGKKYGDPNLQPPKPAFICIWNALKYCIRCWNGASKRHDIYKIAHWSCMAWIANEKNPQAPVSNPLIKKYDPGKYHIEIEAMGADGTYVYTDNQTPIKVI